MPMEASEIEALIRSALPDARITVEALANDGDHYAAAVVSERFRGRPNGWAVARSGPADQCT
jgi:acid stress-induced BolA-like protein IbaG/YrbA